MSIHELQAALRALDEARERRDKASHNGYVTARIDADDASLAVEQAARRVAEGAGEPVAWLTDAGMVYRSKAYAFQLGAQSVQPLYTTPPSADALVEALERLMRAKGFAEIDMAKQAAEQALAKHKENTGGR